MKFFVGILRLAFFWAIPVLAVAFTEIFFPFVNYRLAASTIADAVHGNIDLVSEPAFAYALAAILACFAAGLAVAFFLLHVLPVLFTLWRATRVLSVEQGRKKKRTETRRNFAANFEKLNEKLENNWLIGHAWIEFEETLFDKDSVNGGAKVVHWAAQNQAT